MSLSPKDLHDFEQSSAVISDFFPTLWWRMYQNLKSEGFTEEQAMQIICSYANGLGGGRGHAE